MKKTAFKSALIFTNSYEHFFRLDIPNPAKVLKKVIVKDGSYYILTGDGELWKINIPSHSNKELSDSLVVSNIAATSLGAFSRIIVTEMAANDSIMLAVSDKGHVYSWGRDTRNYGLLGLGTICSADAPTRLLNLSKIQQVSLSSKHAAALDSNGEIYTWGTGNFGELCHPNTTYLNQPVVFRSHELLSGKNVVCHKNLTAVVTTGGHLLLYGSFTEDKLSLVESQERSDVIENNIPGKDGPRTILNMPNVFVTEVYFGPNFCVFLTKSLDIYIISDFYMCQKLDYASKFQTIAVKKNRIYGISDDGKFLVEWEYRRHSSAFLRQGDTLSFMSESCTEVVQVIHLFDEYQKGTHFQPFQETGEVTLLLDSDTNIRPYLKDKSSFSCQNLATVKFQRISGIGNKGKTRNFETGTSKISDRNNAYSTRKVRSPSNGSFISQELSFERNGSGMSSLVFSQDKSRVPSLTETKSPQHTRVSSYSKDKNSEKLMLSQVDETRSSNDSFRTALEKKITLKIENLASAKKESGRSVLDGFEDGFSRQKDNNTYTCKSGGETLKEKKSFYLLNSPTSLMASGSKQRGTVNPNETLSGASKISFKNNEITSWIQEGKGLDRSRDSSLIRPDSFLSPKNSVKLENKGLDRSRESSLIRPDSFLSPKNSVKVFASTTKAADKTTTNTKKSFVFENILPEQVRARSREPSNEPPTVVSPVKDTYKVSTPQRVQQQPQQGAEKNPVQAAQKNQQNNNKFISSASPERVQAKSREVSNEPITVASSMKNSYIVSVPQRVQQQSQQTAEKDRVQPKSINEQSHTRSVSLTQEDNRRINVTNESNVLSTINTFIKPEQNNNKFVSSATRILTKEDNRRPNDTNDSHVLSTVNNSVYSKQGNEKEMRSSSQVNSPPYRGITADTSYTDLYTITSLKPASSMGSIAEDQEKSAQGNYFLPNGNNYPSKGAKTSFINNKADYLSSQSMRTPKKPENVESFMGDKTSQDTIYLDSEYDPKPQSQIVYRNNYNEAVKTSVFSPKTSTSPVKAGLANQKERPENYNRFDLDKAGNSNRSYLKQDQTKLSEPNLIDVKKYNGGLSHQPSPKRGNSEKKYETLVAEKESTKKALYELLGKKMPEASIENTNQPVKETEKRSAFLIEGDYQEGISNNNTDDARSYMRYLGNGSLDLEKHEEEMNSQMSKPIDKDHEKVKSWISSIGPEETREGSLKDFTKTTEGTFFSLVDDTMPKTPQNASFAQTPQNKPAAPQLELEKWGAFLTFMGNEANQSPGTRANSNKSTGKFMIKEYIAKDESSPIRRSIAENIELLKSDDYKNWEKKQKALNMANMLLRKLDRTMYRCFVTLQIYSVKPSSEKTLAVLRLVNALKGAERSFKLKNKEAAFETIKKMKYQSLMKVIPKFAFKKLAGLMRIYTALDKENTLAKQGAFNKLKSIFEKHRDKAENQESFISKSFALLSSKRENQLAETWNALREYTKVKKEKETRTKSLEIIFNSIGSGNRRIKLETAFQELKQKTKISYNLSGLFNVMSRYLLDEGMDTLKSYSQYSQNKKEKYLSLVSDEKNFINLSMEKLLMFFKRRTLYDIYDYSRDQVRKRPKSTQISFSLIMKSLYMRRLKNYYDSLRWHALEQANAKKTQLKDVVLKHLVGILQKKVTERCKEGIDAMKVHQAIVERMKAKEAKELEFKAMLLASKLNVLFKQRKTGAFYALKQSQNLQNQLKNKRYALVSLKNMIENLKKKTLKDAFNEIREVAENEKAKKKEDEEQESKDKHDRKFHGKLDISEINMTKHDSQMSPSELENLLIRNSSGALLHRKSRFRFGNNDDSFGMDQISPFSPEKNEEDIKLDFEGMLAAVKAQRKLYRSWSDILNDKHYLKFNEPPLANVNARKSRSLVLADQEQEHNETYRTASFMDKQKCLGILESLRQSLPASLAKIKNETFRKQTFSSSEESQDNDQPVHKPEPKNNQANSLDMIAIREILGKRALRNSQTIKLTRKRTEYVDQRIFLHKGPHHNRPDEVLEMFHQKVPNHYSNDTSAASVEQPSSKLNLSGFLQMKPSKSMILQSSDNLDRFERKNSIFQREAKSKAEIRTKDIGSRSELAGSVTEIEEFNPDMKSYEGKILTESLDMSSMRVTPTDLKRRNSLFKQTVDKEALKGFEKSDKNDRSFIDLDKDKSDLNQIEEGSSKSSLSGGNEQEQEQDLLQLKSTTSIDGFMQNPKKVTQKNVVTKTKSPRKALTINVIQPSGAKKQEVPKSTKSIASQKSVKVEKSTPSKVKKEDVTKEKTLKKSATLNKPSGGAVQSSTTAKGAGKSLFQTKSPIKK